MSDGYGDSRPAQELQPAHALWKQYAPQDAPYRFRAQTDEQGRKWQAETRCALNETLGFQSAAPVPLSPETVERIDRGVYVREKVILRTTPVASSSILM